MAILSTIKIAVDGAQARRELNRFESGFSRVAGSIRKLTALAGVGGGIGIFAGLQAAIRKAVTASSEIEILEVAFTNLAGSSEEAAKILRVLEEQANKTGVSVTDQADAVRKFLALGFEPERALNLQKAILDVAGSMGLTSFQAGQLGFALSQVAAKGCHGVDSPIRMADGSIKLVQDIKVGDELMGPDGQPRAVLVLARGEQELYKIEPENSEPFVVNLDHQMRLVDREVGETQTVRLRDYLEMDEMDLAHSDGAVPFKFSSVGEGEFFGFSITGDHLYRDAAGFEHHNTVSMEELRQQIAEKGVPVFDALAQKIGVSTGEVIKLVSEGKVASDVLLSIFENFEGPFAKFEGGAEKLGGTLQGVFNRIRASIQLVFRSLGDPIRDALNVSFGPIINDVERLKEAASLFGKEIGFAFRQFLGGDFSASVTNFIGDAPQRARDFGDILRNVGSVVKTVGSGFLALSGFVANNIKEITTLAGGYIAFKTALLGIKTVDFFSSQIKRIVEYRASVKAAEVAQVESANAAAAAGVAAEQRLTAAKAVTLAAEKKLSQAAVLRAATEKQSAFVSTSSEKAIAVQKQATAAASVKVAGAELSLAQQRKLAAREVAAEVARAEAAIVSAKAASGQANARLEIAEQKLNKARVAGDKNIGPLIRETTVAKREALRATSRIALAEEGLITRRVAAESAASNQIARAEFAVQQAKAKSVFAEQNLQSVTAQRVAAATAGSATVTKAIQAENAARAVSIAAIKAQRDAETLLIASSVKPITPPPPVGFVQAGKTAGTKFGNGLVKAGRLAFNNLIAVGTAAIIGWNVGKLIEEKLKLGAGAAELYSRLFGLQEAITFAAKAETGELLTQLSTAKSIQEVESIKGDIKRKIQALEAEAVSSSGEKLNLINAEIAALTKATNVQITAKTLAETQAKTVAKLKEDYDRIASSQIAITASIAEQAAAGREEAIRESLKGQEKLNALRKEENEILAELQGRQLEEESAKIVQEALAEWNLQIAQGINLDETKRSVEGISFTLQELKNTAAEFTKSLSDPEGLQKQKEGLEKLRELTKEITKFELEAATPEDKRLAIAEAIKDSANESFLKQASNEDKLIALGQERLELEKKIQEARTEKEVEGLEKELKGNLDKQKDLALDNIKERRDKEVEAAKEVLQKRLEIERSYRGDGERERLEQLGVRFGGRGAGLPSFISSDISESQINEELKALDDQTKQIILTKEEISKLPEKISEALESSGTRCSTERPTVF